MLGREEQWNSRLSRVPGMEILSQFENDSRYLSDHRARNEAGEMIVFGNSSGGELVRLNEGDEIISAYLVIGSINICDEQPNGYRGGMLNDYTVTVLNPRGEYIETRVEYVFAGNQDLHDVVGLIDITEFVQSGGFGWYYVFNIPYTFNARGSDNYATWQIITVEENSELPMRALELQVGRTGATAANFSPQRIEMNVDGVRTAATGSVTGQFMYSMLGANFGSNNFNRYNATYIVDGVERYIYAPRSENLNAYRVREMALIHGATRNNTHINNLTRFDDRIENHPDFLNAPVREGGEVVFRLRNRLRGSGL